MSGDEQTQGRADQQVGEALRADSGEMVKDDRERGYSAQGIQFVETARISLVGESYLFRHDHAKYSVDGSCCNPKPRRLRLGGAKLRKLGEFLWRGAG